MDKVAEHRTRTRPSKQRRPKQGSNEKISLSSKTIILENELYVEYCYSVQIRTRNLYTLILDSKIYMQSKYSAVYSSDQTDLNQRFLHFV